MKQSKFDTKVQHLKYMVLKTVAKFAWEGTLLENITEIPEIIVPGRKATMRCCVYKERAILSKRVKIAMGGDKNDHSVIQIIDIACDECPIGGYEVTNACRGCLAHRCERVCKFGAISFDSHQKAVIDKSKCVECGSCAKVCPFSAITVNKRPCQNACKVHAISMDNKKSAIIDDEKCISCGACVYQCPFGAITDKSYILDAINIIKGSENNSRYKVYAIVAPAISSQFNYAKTGQVIKGLFDLGFYKVTEASTGADEVALNEARELSEKEFLLSSCCPSFTDYVRKKYPDLVPLISENLSPMATVARHIKEADKEAKVIFIGPCTAKKAEIKLDSVKPYVDTVLTFEELQALFASREIDVASLEEVNIDSSSYYGRIFARSGGLTEAVAQGVKEQNLKCELKPVTCDGIEQCKTALLRKHKGVLDANFVEGMACNGGCIGGAGCLTHAVKDKNQVDKYGGEAKRKHLEESIGILDTISDK